MEWRVNHPVRHFHYSKVIGIIVHTPLIADVWLAGSRILRIYSELYFELYQWRQELRMMRHHIGYRIRHLRYLYQPGQVI
jgi:hypothetical protein